MKINERSVVTFIFLALTMSFVFIAFKYRPDARLFPLLLGIPLSVLLILQLLFDLLPKLQAHLSFLKDEGIFSRIGGSETVSRVTKKVETVWLVWLQVLQVTAWLAGFIILLRFLNYVYAAPLFVLVMIRFQGKESWPRATIAAAGTGIFVYLLFAKILKLAFY